VARTKSPAIAKRNETIYAEWRRGASLTGLGAKHGISRQVIARIVASFHPELEEGEDRALYRGEMWRLYDEVEQIAREPGYKMSPNGAPVRNPDGEPAADTGIALQARDLQLKIVSEMRRMDGRDRPSQRQVHVEFSVAEQQAQADIARREAEMKRQLKLIQGTAEPVDPPALEA
jgi:hypothetical protein